MDTGCGYGNQHRNHGRNDNSRSRRQQLGAIVKVIYRPLMPIEFLNGRPLEPEELDLIRQQLESGFDEITNVDPELRGIITRNWPHLLAKLRSDDEE